jgi:hypothetical protein
MLAPQEADDIAKRGIRWQLELVGLWNAHRFHRLPECDP